MTEFPQSAVPHSREAEEALVGAVLIYPDVYFDAAEIVRPEDLYTHRLRWIWEAFGELAAVKSAIDLVTVSEKLGDKLAEVGGPAYLMELINRPPSSMHWESYARVVADKSVRRKLLEAANKIAKSAYREGEDALESISAARSAVEAVETSLPTPVDGVKPLSEHVRAFSAEMDAGGSGLVMPTGLLGIDAMTDGGFWRERSYLLMGAAKMRKTIMLSEAVIGMAERGARGLFFSLEMPYRDFLIRSISTRAQIAEDNIRNRRMTVEQLTAFNGQLEFMTELPIHMTSTGRWSIDAIRAEIHRHKEDLSFVAIDYMGRIADNPRLREEHHNLEWKARAIKDMAKDFRIAVIAIHTLTGSGTLRAPAVSYEVDHAMRIISDKEFKNTLPLTDPRRDGGQQNVIWLSEDFVRYGAPHNSQPFVADPYYPTVRDMARQDGGA